MSLTAAIEKMGSLSPISVPELRYLQAAAARVRERWPDVQVAGTEQEREALAQRLRDHVERWDWEKTRLSFVISAASAVFDPERRDRDDLAKTRDFLYAEIATSTSATFLSGILRAYLETYEPKANHTTALAKGLKSAASRMGGESRLLFEAVPELLDPSSGPKRIAERMVTMSDPFTELVRLGVRSPHGTGFMDHAHLALTTLVRPELSEQDRLDWYISWLRPPGKEEGRTAGAEAAIEALIYPWLDKTPEDKLRSYLVETLIELYGDPRIKSGGVWGGIDARYMAIVHRWLTREDMRFFTGVVDAAQKDAMWPPRRDFWLKLYDEGLIDAAWAALSSRAFEYARENLMRQDAKNAYTRVGFQRARQNTSLLIMKIGNKIMVDGCHSYRTHVFDIGDPMAPKLFEEGYDCQEIMRASDHRSSGASKSHSNIPSWGRWVRDMINADVPRAREIRPYTKVFRPRPPQPRYTPHPRPAVSRYADSRRVPRGGDSSPSDRDLFSSYTPTKTTSAAPTKKSTDQITAPPASVAAAKRVLANPPKSSPVDPSLLKRTRFPTLTDRMIAYGPAGAEAVLRYLDAPTDGQVRPRLSPKSREGLAWVRAVRGDLPLSLRNPLEYLLIALKTSGVDLDALFSSSAASSPYTKQADLPLTGQKRTADPIAERFPPLPDDADGRLELLIKHVTSLEDLGMWQSTFEERKELSVAFKRLRTRSPHFRSDQRAKIEALYERLRQAEKDRLK